MTGGAVRPLALYRSPAQASAMTGERWRIVDEDVTGDGPGAVGVVRALRARAYGFPGEVQGTLAPFVTWLALRAGLLVAPASLDEEALAAALLAALEREGLARPLTAVVLAFPRP